MKILILILALTCAAVGQSRPPKWFSVEYDRFKDRTHVSFLQYGTVVTYAGFIHDGKILTSDQDDFYLLFDPQRKCNGFCFHDPTLIVMIDGERVTLGTETGLDDDAYFPISRKTVERLASATNVEYQVGTFEGKWDAKAIAKFKTLLDLGTIKK